jgi:tetratricopeptide (TPR) repeat protein
VEPDFTALLAALEARDHLRVTRLIAAFVAAESTIGERWVQLARAAFSIGEFDLANGALAIRARQEASNPAALFDQVVMLARTNRPADARDLLLTLPETIPDRAGHWYLRGTLELNLGNFAAAREALEHCLAVNPASGQAMLALAATGPISADDDIDKRLASISGAMEAQPLLERVCYHYARCKLFKDFGDHQAAFSEAGKAGALCGGDRPFSAGQDRNHARAIREAYSAASIDELRAQFAEFEIAPIFVLGLPRTGTTLLQQILGSHSAVASGGELGRIPVAIRRMGGVGPNEVRSYARRHPSLGPARLYDHLARQANQSSAIVLDKSIENTRYAGLIKAVMPRSKLVWIRRDPLDSAWSVFSTYFTRSLNWSFDLESIGRHHAIEQRLHEHWAGILGDDLLTIEYEQLVGNPVVLTRQILVHCGLPEEEGPFRHHQASNSVATASVSQVRQPVYQTAKGAAEPYRQLMEPYFAAFQQELEVL